ncbi:MAG: DUF423 domain-containing protein [Bacteroidota bacterium]
MTAKFFLVFASIAGFVSVALGAFGAHALQERLSQSGRLDTYQTAVQYQFYHSLALLAIGILLTKYQNAALQYAGISMVIGILVFSGSLYILCFTGMRWLGAVTPIGGTFFLIAWALLVYGVSKAL